MKRRDYEKLINRFIKDSVNLSAGKAKDYAGNEDILANFKRVGKIAKEFRFDFTNSTDSPLMMCTLKMDRIINLLKNKKQPTNESVKDSFMDLLNYVLLTYANFVEENIEDLK